MAGVKKKTAPRNLAPEMLHTAARLEDRYHSWAREKATKRGWHRTVIAYDSYGSENFIRVLARVVLTKTGQPAADTQPRSAAGGPSATCRCPMITPGCASTALSTW